LSEIITAIDIGSSNVSAIICRENQANQIETLGMGMDSVTGIKKGIIIDIGNVAESIKKSIGQAERMSGIKVESAFVNVSSANSEIICYRNDIIIKNNKQEICFEEKEQIEIEAKNENSNNEKQVIDIIPRQYIIDGYDEIMDPLGMIGSKLELDSYLVIGKTALVQNIVKSMEKAGLKINGFVAESLANYEFLLNSDEKETGAVIINVGGKVTDISVFKGDRLLLNEFVPIGGDHITNDISLILNIPISDAEKIKRKYNLALRSLINNDISITINQINNKSKNINASEIIGIIEARVYDIFAVCRKVIQNHCIDFGHITRIILTGRGISNVDGGDAIAKKIFGIDTRIVLPKSVGVSDLGLITATALATYVSKHKKNVVTNDLQQQKFLRKYKTQGQFLKKMFKKLF
jgi:cell division protein FtsA